MQIRLATAAVAAVFFLVGTTSPVIAEDSLILTVDQDNSWVVSFDGNYVDFDKVLKDVIAGDKLVDSTDNEFSLRPNQNLTLTGIVDNFQGSITGTIQTNKRQVSIGEPLTALFLTADAIQIGGDGDTVFIRKNSSLTTTGLNNASSLAAGGALVLEKNASFTTNGIFSHSGAMTLKNQSTFTANTSFSNNGTMTLEDNATFAYAGSTDFRNCGSLFVKNNSTLDFSTANGTKIKNDGWLVFEGTQTPLSRHANFGGIDNSTTRQEDATGIYLGYLANDQVREVFGDILKGSAGGNIGFIKLDSSVTSDLTLTGAEQGHVQLLSPTGEITFDVAKADIEILSIHHNAGGTIKGKNIIIDSAFATVTNQQLGSFHAQHGGKITILNDQEFLGQVSATHNGAIGDIIVDNGDIAANIHPSGRGTTFLNTVTGNLRIGSRVTVEDMGSFSHDITFTRPTVFANRADGVTGFVDLSGSTIDGIGLIDNAHAGHLTMLSQKNNMPTALGSGVTLRNADADNHGVMTMDSAMLAASHRQFDNLSSHGFGEIILTGDAHLPALNWSYAAAGTLKTGVSTRSLHGTIDLGLGELHLAGSGAVIETGSSIRAARIRFLEDTINNGALLSNLTLDPGTTFTNGSTGHVDLSGSSANNLVFGDAASVFVNQGIVTMSKDTVIHGGVNRQNQFMNAGSVLNASGHMATAEWENLFGNGIAGDSKQYGIFAATGDIGTVNITDNLQSHDAQSDNHLVLDPSATGQVTFSGSQHNNAVIDAGGADLAFTADDNRMSGSIHANRVAFTGENGIYHGQVAAVNGITIDADSAFHGGLATTNAGATTVLTSGNRSTVTGVLDTMMIVEDNAVIHVGGSDNDLDIRGSLHASGGAVIEFGPYSSTPEEAAKIVNTTGTGALILTFDPDSEANTTQIILDERLPTEKTTYTLFSPEAVKAIQVDGNPDTTIEDINSFLAAQNFNSILKGGVFQIDPSGAIKLETTPALTEEERQEQWIKGLQQSGIYPYRDMLDAGTIAAMYAYSSLSSEQMAALRALSPEHQYLAKLYDGIGGGVNWNNLSSKPPGEAYATAQMLTGNDIPGSLLAVADTLRSFTRSLIHRASSSTHHTFPEGVVPQPHRIWANYSGLWGKTPARRWDKGHTYDVNGFSLGYDFIASSDISLGAAFNYAKIAYENLGALDDNSTIDAYSIGLYGRYTHPTGITATGLLSASWNDYQLHNRFSTLTENRFTGWDHAAFRGRSFAAGASFGYDYTLHDITFTPSLGLHHYRASTRTFDTTHRRNMQFSRSHTEIPLDLVAKYSVIPLPHALLTFVVNAGYTHTFLDHNHTSRFVTSIGDAAGDTRSPVAFSSGWRMGGGGQFSYDDLAVSLLYEYGDRGQRVMASLDVSF